MSHNGHAKPEVSPDPGAALTARLRAAKRRGSDPAERAGRRERTEAALRSFLRAVGYTGAVSLGPAPAGGLAGLLGAEVFRRDDPRRERLTVVSVWSEGEGAAVFARCRPVGPGDFTPLPVYPLADLVPLDPGLRRFLGDALEGTPVAAPADLEAARRAMARPRDFAPGDAVYHRPTGRLMEVVRLAVDPIDQAPRVHCRWEDRGEPCTGRFVPQSLELVAEAPGPDFDAALGRLKAADARGVGDALAAVQSAAEREADRLDNLDRLGEELRSAPGWVRPGDAPPETDDPAGDALSDAVLGATLASLTPSKASPEGLVRRLAFVLKAERLVVVATGKGGWVRILGTEPEGALTPETVQEAGLALLAWGAEAGPRAKSPETGQGEAIDAQRPQTATSAADAVETAQRSPDGDAGESGDLGGMGNAIGKVDPSRHAFRVGDPVEFTAGPGRTVRGHIAEIGRSRARVGEWGTVQSWGVDLDQLRPIVRALTPADPAHVAEVLGVNDPLARSDARRAEFARLARAMEALGYVRTDSADGLVVAFAWGGASAASGPEPIEAVKARLGIRHVDWGLGVSARVNGNVLAFTHKDGIWGNRVIGSEAPTEDEAIRALDAKLRGACP